MKDILNTLLILIAVVDPLGSIPVFLEATKKYDLKYKKLVARNSTVIAFLVLLFFIVVGQIILEGMEITLEAFQISGGIILFLFALTMVFGEGKPESEKHLIKDYKHVTVFPVAVPSIASPGAIMAIVLLTDNHIYTFTQQLTTTLLLLLVVVMTYILFRLSSIIQKKIGESGIIVISKIMGLILASYAAQSILSGIKDFFSR